MIFQAFIMSFVFQQARIQPTHLCKGQNRHFEGFCARFYRVRGAQSNSYLNIFIMTF